MNSRNEVYSDDKPIIWDVPQGSISGPILFLIYKNGIINASNNVSFTQFADDTSFTVTDSNLTTLHAKVCQETRYVNNWIRANKL